MSTAYYFEVSSTKGGKTLDIDIPKQFVKAFEARYGYGARRLPVSELYELRQLVAVFAALRPVNHPIGIDAADEDVNTKRPGWYKLHKEDPETGELTASKEDIEIMTKLKWWAGRFARGLATDSPFDVYDLDSWFFDEADRLLEKLDEMADLVKLDSEAVIQSVIG